MKNGEFPNKETQFTSEKQPDPEAKSKGWERRREAQQLLDLIKGLGDMSYKEIKELLDDVKLHPESHTLKEVKIAQYLMKEKFTVDYLDRHISKAPQEIVMGGDMELKITREIINEPKH
jgi:hypothetical protein